MFACLYIHQIAREPHCLPDDRVPRAERLPSAAGANVFRMDVTVAIRPYTGTGVDE